MPRAALGFGAALILVGLISYIATGAKSLTALIPSYAGVLLAAAGMIAFRPELRKHAMHGAAAVAAVGLLAAGGRMVSVLLRSAEKAPSIAGILSMGAMAALCVVFLVLCIRSFIAARRVRTIAE